jgi:hypothetical protein
MARRVAPAAARNREPILGVLNRWLRPPCKVVEIASGSGEHALWFAQALPEVAWQPTDRDEAALASIEAWRAESGPENLLAPLQLDASAPDRWPVERADAIVCINMVHISPWRATQGLIAGAERILPAGGLLYLYGPYFEAGVETAPSNLAFDESLRSRDPTWGMRDLAAVKALGAQHGLTFRERAAMPANNLSLVFQRD